MTTEHMHVDITDAPELLHLAETVRRSGRPHVLRCNNEDLVVVSPARPRRPKDKTITEADREAARSAFGGWKGVGRCRAAQARS